MFEKIMEFTPTTWIVLAALVTFGAMVLLAGRGKQRFTPTMLAQAALCMAMAFVLSYVRLYRMPMGGSITLASMLPLFLFAYFYGWRAGLLVGMAYGFLQMVQGADIKHPIQVLLDYPLAFGALGLAGLVRGLDRDKTFPTGLVAGILIGTFGRGLFAVLSGVVFWAEYAPEGSSPLMYSFAYNMTYLIPDALICVAICLVPGFMGAVQRLKALKS